MRGGSFLEPPGTLSAAVRPYASPTFEHEAFGFRVVAVPEPKGGLLQITGLAGLLGLAGWRRARA